MNETDMDRARQGASAEGRIEAVGSPPALIVDQATLFITDFDRDGGVSVVDGLLAETLSRLKVMAHHQRVVALNAQPLLGRQCQVRVTPCLVLDTGTRLVRLPGDPKLLNSAGLETALSRH